MSDDEDLWRKDHTYLEAGLFGAAFGALFTFIVLQFYQGTPSFPVSDFADVIVAITAVAGLFLAKRWREEAIERRKAELAIRILNAAVGYAELNQDQTACNELDRGGQRQAEMRGSTSCASDSWLRSSRTS